jgi:hypothetical protein
MYYVVRIAKLHKIRWRMKSMQLSLGNEASTATKERY